MASPSRDDTVVRVGPQGRIVIPAAARRELGFEEGTLIAAHVVEGALVLERRDAVLRRLRRRFANTAQGVSLVDELLADRRDEVARDER